MINTFNESSLHKTLKTLYCEQYNGKTEQNIGSFICDIVTPDGAIIEIQTANLCKLLAKVLSLLPEHPVRVVYPLVTTKYIETHFPPKDKDDKERISRRKSPKKNTIYSIFDELMGIWPLLIEKNFTLEVVFIEMTEIRTKTTDLVQSVNKRRHFRKDWNKTGKRVDKINHSIVFTSKADYISLIPNELSNIFCAKDLSYTKVGKQAHKMIWTYNKAGFIEYEGKQKRTNYYKWK